MKKATKAVPARVLVCVLFVFFWACTRSDDTATFPQSDTEFVPPVNRPFTFSESKRIEWRSASLDTIPVEVARLNVARVVSRPFLDGGFRPFAEPRQTKPLDFANVPVTPLDPDTLTAHPLRMRKQLLGQPRRIKADYPRLKDGATQNILVFSQDQGLPGNVGFSFLQDSRGWLWIGTDNGLCRFDGEYCETFTTEQGLSDNNILLIAEDQQGKIWLQNRTGGVDVLDLTESTLSHLLGPPEFNEDMVTALLVDRYNQVWVGTLHNGLYLINAPRNNIRQINIAEGLSDYEINALMENQNGTIWISTYRGLDIVDSANRRMLHPTADAGRIRIMDMCQNIDGRVWLTVFEEGVFTIDEQAGEISLLNQRNGLVNNEVLDIYCDSGGLVWIGTAANGVNVVDGTQSKIRHIGEAEGLSNGNIRTIVEDRQHQIWIGTSAGGVNIVDKKGGDMVHLGVSAGLTGSNIKGFLEAGDGTIWVGSVPGGLDRVNPRRHTIENISNEADIALEGGCWDIIQDTAGKIWLATNNGIFVLDVQNNTRTHLWRGLKNQYINALIQDKDGIIWAATRGNGVVLIDLQKKTLRYLDESNGLSNDYPGNFCEAPNGEMWIGSEGGGISIVAPDRQTVRSLRGKEGLPNESVRDIMVDSLRQTWIATYGGGLVMLDAARKQMTTFTPAQGLGDMTVVTLKERQGAIYAGTGKGLTRIARTADRGSQNQWELKNLTKPQGFLKTDFNTNAFMITRQGQFWLGASDVLTILNGAFNEVAADSSSLPSLTSLEIMDTPQSFLGIDFLARTLGQTDTLWGTKGQTYFTAGNLPADTATAGPAGIDWDSLSGTWHLPVGLTLPYDQNHLTFHFTGNQLSDLNKTRYRYILVGNDTQWNPITSEPFADYRNLSPGSYVFKLSSRGGSEGWSEPAEFAFRIRPPWWQTWWAYLLYAVLVYLVIVLAVRFRTRALQQQQKRLEQTVENRTRELKSTTKELELSLDELKTTQEELIRQEKLASIGQLTKGIVDRILNPLNYINNFSQSSVNLVEEVEEVIDKNKEGFSDNDRDDVEDSISMLKMSINKINEHGNSTARIVGDMQKLLKKRSTQFIDTEINAYLKTKIPVLLDEAMIKETNCPPVNLIFELAGDAPLYVELLPDEFEQALRNMVNNSCYALNEKSKLNKSCDLQLLVGTEVDGETVKIQIRDNGKGMVKKELDQICSPFFTTKPTAKGTGLGLFMSKDIIEDHRGSIDIASTEGEFTEVTITLPLQEVEVAEKS